MYLNGQGVPADIVKAYYWISLSAGHGNPRALDARDYLSKKMTMDQIAEGKRLVQEYEGQAAKRNTCRFCNPPSGKSY